MLENPLNKGGATFSCSSFFLVGITGLEPATSRPPEATQLALNPVENQRF